MVKIEQKNKGQSMGLASTISLRIVSGPMTGIEPLGSVVPLASGPIPS
jgi:hypothetical protein